MTPPTSPPLAILDRAEIIQRIMAAREEMDRILELLLPDGEAVICSHPSDHVEDLSTMEDDGERYRCKRCGAESRHPFPRHR